MCGIVGYVGHRNCLPILIEGLKRLEYRGYDSAGVAVQMNGELKVSKAAGKIRVLEAKLQRESLKDAAESGVVDLFCCFVDHAALHEELEHFCE